MRTARVLLHIEKGELHRVILESGDVSVLLFDADNLECGDFQQPSPFPVELVTPAVFDAEVESYKALVDTAEATAKESSDFPAIG